MRRALTVYEREAVEVARERLAGLLVIIVLNVLALVGGAALVVWALGRLS